MGVSRDNITHAPNDKNDGGWLSHGVTSLLMHLESSRVPSQQSFRHVLVKNSPRGSCVLQEPRETKSSLQGRHREISHETDLAVSCFGWSTLGQRIV